MRLNDALGDKIADSLHLGTAVMNWQSGEEGMRRVSGAATYRFKRIFDRSHAHVRGVDRKMGFGRVRIDQKETTILPERLPDDLADGSNLLLDGAREEFTPVNRQAVGIP